MGQDVAGLIHDLDRLFAIRDANVDVQPENEIAARDLLHVVHDRGVAVAGRDQLVHPMRKGMSAGGSNEQAAPGGELGEFAPQLQHLRARTLNVGANFSPELDDRLMHLWLDVLLQRHFAVVENLLNVRAQLARFRINDLEFLLDAKSENVFRVRHSSLFGQTPPHGA